MNLSVQQRTQLGQTVARLNVRPETNVSFSIAVGTAVPRSVRLHAFSSDLVAFFPQYRGHSYFVVEEQIVIVEPASYQIVAVVPFTGSRAAAPAPTRSKNVKLSTEHRDVIRKHVRTQSKERPAATARAPKRKYQAGEVIDRTITIETFPDTLYREAPGMARYRYFRNDDDVILVDPDEDRVVDVLD